MSSTVEINISEVLSDLVKAQQDIARKSEIYTERLATIGATEASLAFSRTIYTGQYDFNVSVEPRKRGHSIVASGEDVMFLEFGAGLKHGKGHPWAGGIGEVPMTGPGTYPLGKGHWNDPNGWYLPKDKGGAHTYGNPPGMAMYRADKAIEEEYARVAQEVFK